jgi:hypothetical protein
VPFRHTQKVRCDYQRVHFPLSPCTYLCKSGLCSGTNKQFQIVFMIVLGFCVESGSGQINRTYAIRVSKINKMKSGLMIRIVDDIPG